MFLSCTHCSATACEGAAFSSWSFVTCPVACSDYVNSLLYAGSCNPKYVVILYFQVLYSPVNRGGDILYLWIPSSCCSCCCCAAMLLTTVYLNLWVCVGAHPGLWSRIVCQGSLLRYHVKLNVVNVEPVDLKCWTRDVNDALGAWARLKALYRHVTVVTCRRAVHDCYVFNRRRGHSWRQSKSPVCLHQSRDAFCARQTQWDPTK